MKPFAELTRQGQVRRLRPMAHKALEHYDIDVKRVSLLSPEVNTTFRVDTSDGKRYALRINLPGDRTLRQIRSELWWLEALRRDTDLTLSDPLRTREGELIVAVESPGVPEARHCNLFHWIDGRHIHRKPYPAALYKLGAIMAKLHHHSETFVPPEGFMDDRLDKVWKFGTLDDVRSDEVRELFTPERRALLNEATEKMQAAIDKLYADPAGLRFLHADMHLWNVKLHRGQISVFDFGDCLWGYPVQDVGISLFYLQGYPNYAELRKALIDGYVSVRPSPEQYAGEIDAFVSARQVDLISWVIAQNDPNYNQYLVGMLERAEKRLRAWMGK